MAIPRACQFALAGVGSSVSTSGPFVFTWLLCVEDGVGVVVEAEFGIIMCRLCVGNACVRTGGCDNRVVGTARMSSHIRNPSQKSHTNATSRSANLSNLPVCAHTSLSSSTLTSLRACTRYTCSAPRHRVLSLPVVEWTCCAACIRRAARHWALCRSRRNSRVSRAQEGSMVAPLRTQSLKVCVCSSKRVHRIRRSSRDSSITIRKEKILGLGYAIIFIIKAAIDQRRQFLKVFLGLIQCLL